MTTRTLTIMISTAVIAGLIITALACSSQIARLFGPSKVELREAYEDTHGGPTFDHSLFDALLRTHVDAHGWVNYKALQNDRAQLQRYIAALADAPFERMGRDEKLALLINAYNACTLELMLEHPDVGSIRDIPSSRRWDHERWNVGGNVWSLNQIEHQEIRPKFREPRIHFALVCAALSCPPLRAEAFVADRLEAQLEEQTVYVHRHDRWFRLDEDGRTVHLTELYNWYGDDFVQTDGSVLRYVAKYNDRIAQLLTEGNEPRIRWIPYNWDLNSQANRDGVK